MVSMSVTGKISEKGGGEKTGIGPSMVRRERKHRNLKSLIKGNREAERGENPLLSRNCDGNESRDRHWKNCSNS